MPSYIFNVLSNLGYYDFNEWHPGVSLIARYVEKLDAFSYIKEKNE